MITVNVFSQPCCPSRKQAKIRTEILVRWIYRDVKKVQKEVEKVIKNTQNIPENDKKEKELDTMYNEDKST